MKTSSSSPTDRLDLLLTRQGGKSSPADWQRLVEALQTLSDGEYLVTIEPGSAAALRSLQQNKRQWAIFEHIARETGQSKEDIHAYCCEKFLSYPLALINPQTGEIDEVTATKGTSRLSTAEHAEFMTKVEQWGGEWLGMSFEAEKP